jgi:outer membrane receptor protein involved in Fe transport
MLSPFRICVALLLVSCSSHSFAAAQWRGKALADFLQELNTQGYQIIYSSDVVPDELLIGDEPDLNEPLEGLRQLLATHGLTLEIGPAGRWLVRKPTGQLSASQATPESLAIVNDAPALPEIIVTSSLHRLQYKSPGTHTYLDRELATRIPAAAEEAVRITARLPGTAGGGISTRSHIRGGEANEVLFLLDGLRLYEPFHLKDFQSVATIVNSNAIDGIDFYTGAYPARYGDRMSGVMSMNLREAEESIETEIALSFFNASVLSIGSFGDKQQGDWLLAVRRGNLDLITDIIDPEIGSPDYQDYLLHGGWEFGPRTQFSANILVSNDKLLLADVDRGENANAKYRNQVLWLKWKADWNDRLSSETVFSISDITNTRTGTLLLPQVVSGSLDEAREFEAVGLKQDWVYVPAKNWMLSLGVEGKHQDAAYRFSSTKAVASPFDEILDNVPLQVRQFDVVPEGAQHSAYAEVRWQVARRFTVDAGLRWDRQSYTSADDDEQTSPRLSLLYQHSERMALRLGWGQFSQAQEINELQVADGVDSFFAAQRAEHVVANLKYQFPSDINLDVSYYQKSFRVVRPRFENAFNPLTLLPEIQFDRYQINPVKAEAKGAEIMLSRGDAGNQLFWWFGYAWSVTQDEYPDYNSDRAWDQTHTAKAGISWRWAHWDFSAAGEVHTGWPKMELVENVVVDSGRYSTFHTLDVRVSREFSLRRSELTTFLEVSNLYNRQNACCVEYSVTEIAGATELIAREQHWLPLVPSLGIVWRF